MISLARTFALAASVLIGGWLAGPPGLAHAPETSSAQRRVEVVFVLDTTGSMGHLIEGAKRKIWSIARSIVDENPNADVHMGLVAYRDRGDEFVTRLYPLTRDIQALYGELLSFKANGGGDWPESVNEALDVAITKIKWTQGIETDRIVFLVGDAPPHMNYRQDRKYPETLKIAREHGIIVNAVQAGDARDTERAWRHIAQLGGGRYIPIPQDGGKMVVIETPYDREILKLQIEINRTILPYGSIRQRADMADKAKEAASAPASVASDMASYVRKAGKGMKAQTGEGDLVDDIVSGRKSLEEIREEERPDQLQGLDLAEQRKIVDAQSEKRRQLGTRMDELVRQRDVYIAQAQAKAKPGTDSFDEAVNETLRSQTKR